MTDPGAFCVGAFFTDNCTLFLYDLRVFTFSSGIAFCIR